MKATEASLLDFLKKSQQFVIPIYQRTYSWTESECEQLWNDIIRAGSDDDISAHLIGSVVYVEKSLYQVSGVSPLLVIDGQQRLTTVSLILEALARRVAEGEPLAGLSAKKLRHYYLLNQEENGEGYYKLLLTQTDKQSLLSILDRNPLPADYSLRIKENFDFFERQIQQLGDDFVPLWNGLQNLMVVDIALSRDHDNPQLIFESMNSTGRALSQADLIRNFILMGLEPTHQERLYNEHWRPMETAFGQEAYDSHFDSFMRHYLTVKSSTGEIPKIKHVYDAFKSHYRDSQTTTSRMDALVADMHTFAGYYCAMALGQETDPILDAAFHDIRELKVDVAYPLLLKLYQSYKQGGLQNTELESVVRMVESYVFRRAICEIPTNSLNKTFATFSRVLKNDHYLDRTCAHFRKLSSYRRFPNDEEFQHELKQRNLYNFRSRRYWLRRMENHGRKEPIRVAEYTTEHILPQNENLSAQWCESLGENWKLVQETYLHTLGNLTLTGYNSEYSDHPFATKRDMEGGFKESPLHLNKGLGETETWDESAIKERADRLAKRAVKIWSMPPASEEITQLVESVAKTIELYSIDGHPHLAKTAPMRNIFEELRKALLALDECVSEEFRKKWIAYKTETNFVDVEAQSKQLVLYLNLAFYELDDPRNMARDVTNIGNLRNGNMEVKLSDLSDLPYVMSLIRQAFEKQMSSDEMEA